MRVPIFSGRKGIWGVARKDFPRNPRKTFFICNIDNGNQQTTRDGGISFYPRYRGFRSRGGGGGRSGVSLTGGTLRVVKVHVYDRGFTVIMRHHS